MTQFTWSFDRGPYDPEQRTMPVMLKFASTDGTNHAAISVVVPIEAARQLRDDLSEALGANLTVASVIPNGNGGAP